LLNQWLLFIPAWFKAFFLPTYLKIFHYCLQRKFDVIKFDELHLMNEINVEIMVKIEHFDKFTPEFSWHTTVLMP